MGGPFAGAADAPAADAEELQQRHELRGITPLARGEDPGDRSALPVRDQVQLGRQAASGPAECLMVSYLFVIKAVPFEGPSAGGAWRAPAACW
ncbi:hypothetical protein GCM10010252_73310 [Streptomyces aureoverticillatus]|nr:hypothetical protein GCM10010252_73310 [Streptomyces aureoverticillatus]